MARRRSNTDLAPRRSWADSLAAAIDHVDDDACPRLLLEAIGGVLDFDMAMSVVYSRRAKPILVCDTFVDPEAKRGLSNYVNDTYVLNPSYTAFCRGLRQGVYRIRDLAPDAYFSSEHYRAFKIRRTPSEEIGYVTESWPRGMAEIIIAIELSDGELGEISLLRAVDKGGFGDGDIARLRDTEPLIGATFRRYWRDAGPRAPKQARPLSNDEQFERFGGDRLSPRERQVAQLILKGHSGESIGAQLGISVTTVKTHRQNLYAKLGIATQFELFSLFLKSLEPAEA